MGGWVLFRCETLAQALAWYAALAGQAAGDAARHPVAEYLDPLGATAIVAGVLGAAPLARRLGDWRDAVAANGGIAAVAVLSADTLWLALVAVAACAWLAAGTYNPFIYFRF